MITYEEAIKELMMKRGVQTTEAVRLLGDQKLINQLIAQGDLSGDPFVPNWDPIVPPVDPVLPPLKITYRTIQEGLMPGVSPSLIQMDPGVSVRSLHDPSSFFRAPGIVPTDWAGLIRWGIDRFIGPGDPFVPQGPGPLHLPPQSPTPGLFPPGGLQGPVGFGRGGRVPFITMPNGLPGCPSGYHPMKDGQPFCVRNRRMNPLNPRALSRATRRVGGFARAVKRARTIKKVCKSL